MNGVKREYKQNTPLRGCANDMADQKAYWMLEATVIGEFDSADEAIEQLSNESTMVEITIGDKITQVPKNQIGICTEDNLQFQ